MCRSSHRSPEPDITTEGRGKPPPKREGRQITTHRILNQYEVFHERACQRIRTLGKCSHCIVTWIKGDPKSYKLCNSTVDKHQDANRFWLRMCLWGFLLVSVHFSTPKHSTCITNLVLNPGSQDATLSSHLTDVGLCSGRSRGLKPQSQWVVASQWVVHRWGLWRRCPRRWYN